MRTEPDAENTPLLREQRHRGSIVSERHRESIVDGRARGSIISDRPRSSMSISERPQHEPGVSFADEYQTPPITRERLGVVVCVLLVELCERMAYYSVASNIVLFCTSILDLTSSQATTVSFVFTGTVYIIPIIGGYIADSWSSRFNVIFGSGLIYLCGLFLLLCATPDYTEFFGEDFGNPNISFRRAIFYFGLGFLAIASGGIKANVGPFGAQQVEHLGNEAVQVFFNWFYFFINVGSLVAYTLIAYLEQNVSFTVGYFIPLLLMLISLVILNIVRNKYIYKDSFGSVLISSFRICGEACCKQSPFIDGKRRVFDSARREYGGSFDSHLVDGVLAVTKTLPIFCFFFMFWVIYSQTQATYFLQGERMDLDVGGMQVPVAALNAIDTITVMVVIPILDRLVYPCFKYIGRPLTHLQRIGIGFVFSACSVFVAGGIEIYRKDNLGFDQEVAGEVFYASNATVLLQIPQFFLIGTGEAFAAVSGIEFAYTQAPSYMQGLVMGLFLATTGVGNYLSTAIIALVNAITKDDEWFSNEINDSHLENVFFLFGALMIASFLGYLPVAYKYKYINYKRNTDIDVLESTADPVIHRREYSKNRTVTLEDDHLNF